MSGREELLEERTGLVEEMNILLHEQAVIKNDMKEAKTVQYMTGVYENTSIWNEWERRKTEIEGDVREAQGRLSEIKRVLTSVCRGWEMHFIDVCRESLEEEDFKEIMDESRERAHADNEE